MGTCKSRKEGNGGRGGGSFSWQVGGRGLLFTYLKTRTGLVDPLSDSRRKASGDDPNYSPFGLPDSLSAFLLFVAPLPNHLPRRFAHTVHVDDRLFPFRTACNFHSPAPLRLSSSSVWSRLSSHPLPSTPAQSTLFLRLLSPFFFPFFFGSIILCRTSGTVTRLLSLLLSPPASSPVDFSIPSGLGRVLLLLISSAIHLHPPTVLHHGFLPHRLAQTTPVRYT